MTKNIADDLTRLLETQPAAGSTSADASTVICVFSSVASPPHKLTTSRFE